MRTGAPLARRDEKLSPGAKGALLVNMTRPLSLFWMVTGIVVTSLSPPARGQDAEWSQSKHSRAGLEVDIWPTDGPGDTDTTTVVFTPTMQIGVTDHVFIDGEFPLAFTDFSSDFFDESDTVLGNFGVGAHYADEENDILDGLGWWAGGMLVFPTMLADFDDPGFDRGINVGRAATIRGFAQAHRFAPETIAIRGEGGVELRFVDRILRYRGLAAPVVYANYDGGDAEFFLEQINDFDARANFGLGGGVRVQNVFTWTQEDLIQGAAGPYLLYETPSLPGGFARLGVLIAIDEDLGPGTDDGGLLTVNLSGGGKW
ncbi:MAG: hypothetical protein AAGA56_30715 [Myxococcota bacterium]